MISISRLISTIVSGPYIYSISFLGNFFGQACQDASTFLETYDQLEAFKALCAPLDKVLADVKASCKASTVMKIEAMFVHAYKTKVKKTAKELVSSQMLEISANSFGVEESDIQSGLMSWAKAQM